MLLLFYMKVACITPLFAPAGRLSTYHEFKKQFKALGIPLFTGEIAYDGRFESTDLGLKWVGGERNILWQKEAILNAMVEALPKEYDVVAFIDCDLVWPNSKWLEDGKKKLEKANAVQLFEKVLYYTADDFVMNATYGWAAHKEKYSPGGAWMVRREMFPLIDYFIVGGGDRVMARAWAGKKLDRTEGFDNNWVLKKQLAKDMLEQHKKCHNKIDFVDTECFHLYHGEMKNRQYKDRLACLGDYWFDPNLDIYRENGILTWSQESAAGLRSFIKNYFNGRTHVTSQQIRN